jgi:hypothetical protein
MVPSRLLSLTAALLIGIPTAVAAQAPADMLASATAAAPAVTVIPAPTLRVPTDPRPTGLSAMYVSLASLEAYDSYSTLKAVNLGAVEGNPLMSGLVDHPAEFLIRKSVVTVASIYTAEHLWRTHKRRSAVLVMVLTNGVMTAVAAHNASVLHAQR